MLSWANHNGAGTPAQTITYIYDALGGVVTTNDSSFSTPTTQTYDAEGRVTQIASPEGILNYAYDNLGRQTDVWTGTNTTTTAANATTDTLYAYDSLGRLTSVKMDRRNGVAIQPEETDYVYDLVGNLQRTKLPNGVVDLYTYDALNRLTHERVFADLNANGTFESGTDHQIADYVYTLPADGKRSHAVETDDQTNSTAIDWVYDQLGRLTEERYDATGPTNDYIERYGYDLAGNRVQMAKDTGNAVAANFAADEVTTSAYDANDRLLSEAKDMGGPADTADDRFTVYRYGPDANSDGHDDWTQQTDKKMYQGANSSGTLLEHDAYGYDVQGRMTSSTVDAPAGGAIESTTSYTYGVDGVRTSQTVNGVKTVYLYDRQNPTGHAQIVEEKNASGAVTKTYTLGLDIIAQQAPGVAGDAALYLLKDGHGSTRALAGAAGAIIAGQVFAYDAFGNRLDSATALTTILYSGEQIDSTGLSYNLNRYYRASTGTFTTMDSYAGDDQSPQSLHKYLYTHADPVNFNDSSGMDELAITLGTMTVGSMINSIVFPAVIEVGQYAGVTAVGAAAIYTIHLRLAMDTTYVVSHTVSAEFLGELVRELPKVDIRARVETIEELLKDAWNVYLHYSYSDPPTVANLVGRGLVRSLSRPEGPYATREVYPTGTLAKMRLALPNPVPPNAVYFVSPRAGFQPYMFRIAIGNFDMNDLWMPGGGVEYVFGRQGSGGFGTVFGPVPIPKDL